MFEKRKQLKNVLGGANGNIYSFILLSITSLADSEIEELIGLFEYFGYFGIQKLEDFLLIPNATSEGIVPFVEKYNICWFMRVVTNIDNKKCPRVQYIQNSRSIYYNDPPEKIENFWVGYYCRLRSINKAHDFFKNVSFFKPCPISFLELEDKLLTVSEELKNKYSEKLKDYKLYLKDRSGTLCR